GDRPFREALCRFLAVAGRSIAAAPDLEAGIRLVAEKRPAIVLLAAGREEAARRLPEIEAAGPQAKAVLLAGPAAEAAGPPVAAPRAVLSLERGPDLAHDQKELFPAVGHLVAREEERLRLLEENRTLALELERGLKLREELVAGRTRELRERIERLQGE